MIRGDGVEYLLVELAAMAGFLGIGYVFTKIVDAHAHARAIHRLGDAHRVGNFCSRHETPGNALSDRRAFGEITQKTVFRKMDEEGSQHGVRATSKGSKTSKGRKQALRNRRKTTEFCITNQKGRA